MQKGHPAPSASMAVAASAPQDVGAGASQAGAGAAEAAWAEPEGRPDVPRPARGSLPPGARVFTGRGLEAGRLGKGSRAFPNLMTCPRSSCEVPAS